MTGGFEHVTKRDIKLNHQLVHELLTGPEVTAWLLETGGRIATTADAMAKPRNPFYASDLVPGDSRDLPGANVQAAFEAKASSSPKSRAIVFVAPANTRAVVENQAHNILLKALETA